MIALMGTIPGVHVLFCVQLQTNQIARDLQDHGLVTMEIGGVQMACRHVVVCWYQRKKLSKLS